MSESATRFIVVEGPIGVGKTSLARRLAASFGSDLLLEGPEENPFLPRFYEDPKGHAMPTQLSFLLQRVRQLEALQQADMFRPVQVADYLLEKDRLFAELTLDASELELYDRIAERLVERLPVPDLVIYLQAPVAVLQDRIRQRGRDYERHMETAFLESLSDAYTRFFHHYDSAPLLIVNAAEADFVNSDEEYGLLLEQVRTPRHGRHFFNPAPLGL
ncbi:MAG: deoxynucleoside kinase [Pseudomonadota bacterium]